MRTPGRYGPSSPRRCRATTCAGCTTSRRRAICSIAARQFAMLGLATWGVDSLRPSADLDPARPRAGLHDLQLHGAAARGRASRGVRAAAAAGGAVARRGSMRCRAALRPRSSGAGISIITPSSARTSTIPSGTTCRRRSTRAGSSCCTVRQRSFRSTSAPRAASAAPTMPALQQPHRRRTPGRDRGAPVGARC